MKSTGIVRQVDQLGIIVIPIEIRRTLGIGEKNPLEIFVDGDLIVLRAYKPLCYICGNGKVLNEYKNKRICSDCCDDIRQLTEK